MSLLRFDVTCWTMHREAYKPCQQILESQLLEQQQLWWTNMNKSFPAHTQLCTRYRLLRSSCPIVHLPPCGATNRPKQIKRPTNASALPAAPASPWLWQPGAWWMVIFVGADSLGGDGSISGGSRNDLFPALSYSISRRLSWGRRGRDVPSKKRAQCTVSKRGLGLHLPDPPSSAWRVKLKSHSFNLEATMPPIAAKPTQSHRARQSIPSWKEGEGGAAAVFTHLFIYPSLR